MIDWILHCVGKYTQKINMWIWNKQVYRKYYKHRDKDK
jgi:hypothetical protein